MEQEGLLVDDELKNCDDVWNDFCQSNLLGLLCKEDGLIYEINYSLSKRLDHMHIRIFKNATYMLDLKFKRINNKSD